ncbi:Dol-P-Glc:Glc(2)Man(9)GlcNAc(2)-PP-Dol alpha-1,2-glucosyltransferase [Quillaja saponaria]|uniref:Dol-P-Glc:Glc(2)Man(9)GlcNAc(2)-PP-Dol alpha-1,2-glucosyltransferase n=1 Tax=Quillaja saponaria TaxID=32244 RepID=A0AAD7L4B7_QUISA|nr:Dol-P-Glc:Glc(2)Man(9)GlcNAc(2)-PP-Dol alpha-1,2-glucosyltransferase [Quillaja saponaria]
MGKMTVAAIVSLWVIPVSILVNRIVPEPYMDEIFHIPQVQQYCKGNFGSWDPMITTPPGLYYLSLAHVASLFPGFYAVRSASSFSDFCSTGVLRSLNGFLAVICSIILYDIVAHLKPTLDDKKVTLHAVVLTLYPLHWFFTFLYYTDVASVTAVLATYLACLKKNYWLSGLIGAFSVVIRQTNVIWILFVACVGVIDISLTHRKDNARPVDVNVSTSKTGWANSNHSLSLGVNLRNRKFSKSVKTVKHLLPSKHAFSTFSSSGLFDDIAEIFVTLWHMKWELLISFSPFLMVLVAFVAFVYWNGSVVMGAKDAHAVSPHFAQIMYFSLVSALLTFPIHFTLGQAAVLFRSFWKNRPRSFFQGFMALTAGFFSVHFFSIAHPYLLADNRHYPFYLWRKVIKAHWSMKYLLLPLYIYSWLSIISILGKHKRKIWVLAYFLATAAVLVPAPLIEFRYYTIPFYFLVLHCHVEDNGTWLLMGTQYVTLNFFTMLMFLFQVFQLGS